MAGAGADERTDSPKRQRASQRIPQALQEVFVESNQGNEVDTPPPQGEACKVYLRNWIHQTRIPTTSASAEADGQAEGEGGSERGSLSFRKAKSLFGDSKEKIETFSRNIPDVSANNSQSTGVKTRRLSFKQQAKLCPQGLLNEHLEARGYSTDTFKTLHTAYYSKPTESQLASYGPYMVRMVKEGNARGLKEALAAGMSPNPCNQFGESLLHMVCRRGDITLLNILLEHGASVQVADDYGRTPLHDACWAAEPAFEVVQAILKRDNRLFYMMDCRGSLPLSYVHRDHFAAWEDFLVNTCLDTFFPVDNATMEAPELCKLWPNARHMPNPKNAMPLEWVKMVAAAKMTVAEARILSCDTTADEDDDDDDDSYEDESEEEDDDDDSDYDSDDSGVDSEELDEMDKEILVLARSINANRLG